MKRKMKWIAGQMAAVMAAGCIMSVNVMAAESAEIPEGLYAWFLVQAYDAACGINGGKTDLWENEIEGTSAQEWITEKAKSYAREYIAVEQEFAAQNMEFTEEEKETIESTLERYWNELGYGRYYEDYQITEEDFRNVLEHSAQISKLYAEEREELEDSVTEEDLAAYVEEHGNVVQYIAVPYTDVLDEDATDEEKAAWVDTDAIYEEYRQRLDQGEKIEDLLKEINDDEEKQAAGISSSYSETADEVLFLDSNSSLSSGFKTALDDAEEEEITYFDDAAQYYQIIFVKKPFSAEWEGIDQYKEDLTSTIAGEKFEDEMRVWSEEIEIANESELMEADEVEEMFA